MNALHPRLLSAEERQNELCTILALGLLRLKNRQSSELFEEQRDSSLHNPPHTSGHATHDRREV